jgi:translation initiation factor IF-3
MCAANPATFGQRDHDISRDLRVNQMIRVPQVRVVDEDGSQLGVMPTQQAMAMAQDRGLDLVEVAPMAAPPVVRFLDFGQYKYELTKREKEAKRKQRAVEFKEVRLTPKIGTGDFETKVHRAIEFLEDGDRIKVTVRFRGRELTHPEIGRNLLARFGDAVKEHGTVDRTPALEGKSMFMTLLSVHKPKVHEHRLTAGRAEGEGVASAPDSEANAGPEIAPETTPEIERKSEADTAPEPASEMTPAASLETMPENATNSAPEVTAEAATDKTTRTAPKQVRATAPAESAPAGE